MTITTAQAVAASPWADRERPATPQQWIRRAEEVAAILAVDAVQRDRELLTPYDEVGLLKQSGLVTLLGPAPQGGAGQSWATAYQVIRRVAAGDGSIGQLLGYHYLWSQLPAFYGTLGQAEQIIATSTREGWFFGGAVNPRDDDLIAVDTGDDLSFTGAKTFSTGSKVSDVTWLEAAVAGHDEHIFALAPSDHPGITFHDGWDALGQRLTESGSVTVTDVVLPWSAALGWVDKQFRPRTYNTLTLPAIQLVFTSFYLGIASGGLQTALEYTRERTRPWPYGGDDRERAADEPYILDTYGDLQSKLWAAQALADQAGDAIEELHLDPDGLTPRARGEVAVLIAAAKQRAVDVGLEIGTRVYEVTGARATASAVGLDRFWRNVRTHSLHDPIAYKRREVGVFALLDEVPEPTWYT
ncbi:acyl-CoA dehydrogenase family protein [Actinotalea sp. K2]|uniref:acyl-CoA dehydrogenase family protein n=1 Tax=Actinotalea sp. K2 TaxID=2939438 RepID=UPI002017FC48|nr:acyl-CoA dehydrogenase family protein [Actinotalea sp. K2]MCL3860270.1 monooxygenase [Actinotalea sp. K2]